MKLETAIRDGETVTCPMDIARMPPLLRNSCHVRGQGRLGRDSKEAGRHGRTQEIHTIADSLTCLLGHHGMDVDVVDMWVRCCKERTVYIRRYRLVRG